MNLTTFSGVTAAWTTAYDHAGREHLVVVGKATFDIQPDGHCRLATEQVPPTLSDQHYGDPAATSILYESDFALRKPRADIVVNGYAHAPTGRLVSSIDVMLSIGSCRKTVRVVGNRVWERSFGVVEKLSHPEPFGTMPLRYELAYGGIDTRNRDPSRHAYEPRNLVGVGFCARGTDASGIRLPNLEDPDAPITSPADRPTPIGFGFLARNWMPRYTFAGTYDATWREERFPFLPSDFSSEYFQGAPADQQLARVQGGELIALTNMTPNGSLKFRLPAFAMPMCVAHRSGLLMLEPTLDTLIIEPEHPRCIAVWRASHPAPEKLTDLREVWVGQPSKARLIATRAGKRHVDWRRI